MAERILGPTGSARRKRFLLVPLALVALAAFFVIAGAQATSPEQNPPGYFELDKNLINNEQTPSFLDSSTPPVQKTLGALGGNISATATSFTVCQNNASNPATPITIQVEAERMTVGAITNASGGGCSGTFKRTYSSVARGALGTTAASHGASGVQGNVTQVTFKRTYSSITRGVAGGGAAASHGASGVQGNVTQVTFNTVAGDDWDQVKTAVDANNARPPAQQLQNPCSGAAWSGNANAKACDWINDPPGQTVFTTGGSKDDLDINTGVDPNITHNWMYTNSSVPDADDINDGYAIKYEGANPCPPGVVLNCDHQFLYFGADRTAVNGSKDMGFWFFKNPVGLNPDGTFSGQHTIGDILLLGTFTGGGATTTIRIFKWVGTGGDTNGTLNTGGNFGDCVPGGGSDGCNTVNNGTLKSPWAYQSKISGTPANTIFAGGAMEGGADLTALNLTGCFSSFLVETRSAPSIGAQLKDFLTGKFEACTSGLTTTPQDAVGSNDGSHDLTDHSNPPNGLPDVSIGSGSVQVTDKAVLNISGAGQGFTGTLSFALCGPIASGTCDKSDAAHTGTTIAAAANTNPVTANGTYHSAAATITSAGRYCWRGEFTSGTQGVPNASDSSATECFEVLPVTPALTTDATDAVEIGNAIDDTAHLTGTANKPGTPVINPTTAGGTAGGTITFKLYGPAATATCNDSGAGANLVATRVVNIKTSDSYTGGDGFYKASDGTGSGSLSSLAAGTYYWTAQYSGDSPNTNGVGPTTCGEEGESSRVVDARISITPTATNEVGQEHTFTVLLEATDASGTFQPVQGEKPSVTLTPSNGASVLGKTDNCASTGTGADGKCTVVFHSDTAGQVTGHASITFSVGGVSLTRATGDSHTGDSADAVKTYVDARISITPDATNEVGKNHTFTVLVEQDDGLTAAQGGDGVTGFTPKSGLNPAVTLTPSNGASVLGKTDNCASTGTGADGKCTVVFHSDTAGQVTGHASITFSVGGVSLTRATGDSHTGDSADAVKTYVDAKITIGPASATNTVGDPHTFTVTVSQDDGLTAAQGGDGVTGFTAAPNGTPVAVSLVNSDGANWQFTGNGDLCAFPAGTVGGVCTVTFTSQSAGTVTGNASTTFSVGGVSLTRDTDSATASIPCGGGLATCGPAVKHFVAGSISWQKVDNGNRLQGGATFTLCKTYNYNLVTKAFDDIPDICWEVADNGTTDDATHKPDADAANGKFKVIGLSLGRYTVKEHFAPAGYEPDPRTETVELTPNDPGPPPVNHTDAVITLAFVNSRPIVKITGFGYVNAPTGDPQPDGIFRGSTTYTVNLHNYGTAVAHLTGSSLSVSSNAVCVPGNLLDLSGIDIAVGGNNPSPITLTCSYDHPVGPITATLVVKYTTNGHQYTASGSPASITFNVNPD